jgi:hypothetical protein
MRYRRGCWVAMTVVAVIAVIAALFVFVTMRPDGQSGAEVGQFGGDSHDTGELPSGAPTIAAQSETAVVLDGDPDSKITLYDLSVDAPVFQADLPFTEPVVYPDVTALGDGIYLFCPVYRVAKFLI